MYTIFLGIGTNLGDRRNNIKVAYSLLQSSISDIQLSNTYESKPFGFSEQENFLNCVLKGKTTLSPTELLSFTQRIEREVGRIKRFKNGPREVDIDILFYEDLSFQSHYLQIPHPHIALRDFVLTPLVEIDRHFIHPVYKLTVETLLKNIISKPYIIRKLP